MRISVAMDDALNNKPTIESFQYFRAHNLNRGTALVTRLKLADTSRQRRKGLLGRSALEPGEGLWIFPCESVHTFGMRFSIDLIYLDSRQRVIKLQTSFSPWRMSVCIRAKSVLEVRAGSIQHSATCVGDQLEISRI